LRVNAINARVSFGVLDLSGHRVSPAVEKEWNRFDRASYLTIARTIPGRHEAPFTPHREIRREAQIAARALAGQI
jgi:hypothetical protein